MYPIITGYLSAERREWKGQARPSEQEAFAAQVEKLGAAVVAGTIPNVDYKSAKDMFNRALDTAVDNLRKSLYYPIMRGQSRSWIVQEFERTNDPICPYIHVIPGRIRKLDAFLERHVNAFGDDAGYLVYINALRALYADVLPLSEQMAQMKDKIVKRQPKPAEEPIGGYEPPTVSTEAQRRVVLLLETVTAQAYEELKATFLRQLNGRLSAFLKAAGETNDKKFSPHKFFVENRKVPDYRGSHLIGDAVQKNSNGAWSLSQETFEKLAKRDADDIRHSFVHKNFRKIASIIDAKGNLDTAEALRHTVSLEGLEGTFFFKFDDGSRFTVVNSVVGSYSVLDNFFLRFPLTFHDVYLPGGTKKLSTPSEKRMNEIFAKE